MDKIEKAKLEVQLMKVEAAKKDMEIRVMEYELEIERIRENVKVQEKALLELRSKFKE